ncbi:leukocyte elastase inhibitor-like [Uranotaenia lowii]|uniref:leukocyte elastase inhibitor-like n=1 Tax=Uranotaenia lowii TaxID=190385 RepID=UPI00247984F4|nr:leukocyte elastase inhibitor-like [Uranotaenia lowii]
MKLFIVLCAFIALGSAQRNNFKNRSPQKASEQFYDERSCEFRNNNPFGCVCEQLNIDTPCDKELQEFLGSNPNLKLCKDSTPYYFGNAQKCKYDVDHERDSNPTGKAMQFALDLFRQADPRDPTKNFVISPLSPQILLAQLIDGCSEDARLELIRGVRLNSREMKSLVDALKGAASKDDSYNKLDIASVMFKSPSMQLTSDFNVARKNNEMKLEEVSFNETQLAVKRINDWVNHQTRGNIKQIVSEQNLAPDTMMMLLNAIYFKGTWRYKFNESITDKRGDFESQPGNRMAAHMMGQVNKLRFGDITFDPESDEENGFRWVELPYEGDQLSMIVFLPKKKFALDEYIPQLTGEHLQSVFKTISRDFNPVRIHLKLPKFTIKDTVSLVEPLKKLGVNKIFDDSNALSKMSKTPAKVGDVKQDSFLSVDEQGTTATAATRVTIIPLSLNPYEDIHFVANHPFMLMLVDKTSQIPLFMANVRKPFSPKKGGRV